MSINERDEEGPSGKAGTNQAPSKRTTTSWPAPSMEGLIVSGLALKIVLSTINGPGIDTREAEKDPPA